MLQCFFDDSGRGQMPVFLLAGYLVSVEQWDKFSQDWKAELGAPPTVEYFKMKEAAHGTGQFVGHAPELIANRVDRLVTIITNNVQLSITSLISQRAYNMVLAPYFKTAMPGHPMAKIMSSPYLTCFYNVIMLLINIQWKRNVIEPIDFIFDNQGKEGMRVVKDYWAVVRDTAPNDAVRAMMLNEPVFRDDKDVLPLQAADLTAWHVRRGAYEHAKAHGGDSLSPAYSNAILKRLERIPGADFFLGVKQCHEYIARYEQVTARKVPNIRPD